MSTYCHHCGGRLDESQIIAWGGWSLDEGRKILNKSVRLEPQQVKIMSMLIGAHGRVVSDNQVLTMLYHNEDEQPDGWGLVKVQMCKIRKRLSAANLTVETSWSKGYYLKEIT